MKEEKHKPKYHYQPKQIMVDGDVWLVYRWIDKNGNELPIENPAKQGHPIDTRRKIKFL